MVVAGVGRRGRRKTTVGREGDLTAARVAGGEMRKRYGGCGGDGGGTTGESN